ncbi:MAG: HPr kinase/phosphatase C-terminal domain-containing protein [Paracoccaceae bacterium]|nr:HPr kinase/phosphatase C-terminal domain-containing protein [Paracoccaceae bacterium]
MTAGPHSPPDAQAAPPCPDDATQTGLHGTSVAIDGRGVLILGPSGAGKSSLALHLMAFGARLVADDYTLISRRAQALFATCPPPLSGLIEARGLGLLRADPVPEAKIDLIVDLEHTENHRLPPHRSMSLLGLPIALVFKTEGSHFAAAILHYIKAGRAE